ncbi:hypothetical protein BV898_01399 [Hypsibius exemplaris]|uniref:Uncharacterized protein n=1 Tax=Hypsibius exemplaris TaxID=2072580 RepID=A0A1W0XBC0_HYPEX|nr:hypothetical protein BV898_01399 [Hypsibius exemplaris]
MPHVKQDKATVLEAAVHFLEYFHGNVHNVEQFNAEYTNHLNAGQPVVAPAFGADGCGEVALSVVVPAHNGENDDTPMDLSIKSLKRKKSTTSVVVKRPAAKTAEIADSSLPQPSSHERLENPAPPPLSIVVMHENRYQQ